ncbi:MULTISPECIES: leucine-rich repeat domain-containing protein [unclassified Leptospira]|uniref:leucine-rich repeat domain-containing protein n=1 Tax=unclassified Leptospira TaxID=2633828 RepID=UPI0002BD9B5B|nr:MULTISPECIES: leucine-rich repeat domain-containing protein [unclassified Leptospira]EMJ99441.1 leucine rich repeat protein [Leptospira sp. B5-022]MCR1792311.1 leucine-rich repeat domain-containing protein [Leptospira sp. id769339]
MRKTFLILYFLFACSQSNHLIPVRNSEGEVLGKYPKEIRWLGFENNPSWSDLSAFSELEVLELNSKEIKSLEGLSDLPKLRSIHLSGSSVKDLSPLNRFAKLDSLILNQTELTDQDLNKYLYWNRLTRIELTDSKISNLGFLGSGCSVRHLQLKHTQIKDLRPLEHCTNLIELYLGGTQVKDLSPLYGLTNLVHLQLDGSDVSAKEISDFRKIQPYVKIMPGLRKIFSSETGLD